MANTGIMRIGRQPRVYYRTFLKSFKWYEQSARNITQYCECLHRRNYKTGNSLCTSQSSMIFTHESICSDFNSRRYMSSKEKHIIKSPFRDIIVPTSTLTEYVWGNLHQWPDKTAIVCGLTGRTYTYAQLREQSQRFAVSLLKIGLKSRDVIAILLPNTSEFPIVFLGAVEAGLTVTTLSPNYTQEEIAKQLHDSGTKCVVTLPEKYEIVSKACNICYKGEPPRIIVTENIDGASSVSKGAAIHMRDMVQNNSDTSVLAQQSRASPEDIIILPYSSGTTGLPKGVMLSHRNLVTNCLQLILEPRINIGRPTTNEFQDVVPALLPFFHIYGLVVTLINKLATGAKIVTLPKFEPARFLDIITTHKATLLYLVPPIVMFLASHPSVKREHLSSIHVVMSGAAPIGMLDIERLLDKVGSTNMKFIQGYGLTETSPVIIHMETDSPKLSSVGVPVPNTEIKVVDAETRISLPSGEVGELCVKGPQVMKGYLNKPEATAEVLDESGWLRTGDLGYYDEENIFYIVDRFKELIKVKGYQVAPAELEEILRSHPKIDDAAVIGIPHPKYGEVPRAYVVLKDPTKASAAEDEIKQFIATQSSKHKHLVGGVEFINSIPKNPSGKILRRVLKNGFLNK